jgi:hypothetical protein
VIGDREEKREKVSERIIICFEGGQFEDDENDNHKREVVASRSVCILVRESSRYIRRKEEGAVLQDYTNKVVITHCRPSHELVEVLAQNT